jgi:hypothetical protein
VASGQCHAPAEVYPRERAPVPTGQEAGWAPEPVWTQSLEEKSFAPPGVRRSVVQSVVRLTELPRLHANEEGVFFMRILLYSHAHNQ